MSCIQVALEHVTYSYEGTLSVIQDISFEAKSGESIGIIGANGVGKSTLLRILVGLELGYEGSVQVAGSPVIKKNLPGIRAKVGYVFQDSDSQLFTASVYDDVAFAPKNYGMPQSEVNARVEQALQMVQIGRLKDRQIYKLSGGEKKLASIATILSMTPDINLMDEPSIALDPKNRRNLIRILNSFGQLKIIASHDLDLILDTCSRTILMDGGRIICDGATETILTDAALLDAHGLELPLCLQKGRLAALEPALGSIAHPYH